MQNGHTITKQIPSGQRVLWFEMWRVMMMFHALIVAFFLILVATSAAVAGSMIVLALLDLAFGKKSTHPLLPMSWKVTSLRRQPS